MLAVTALAAIPSSPHACRRTTGVACLPRAVQRGGDLFEECHGRAIRFGFVLETLSFGCLAGGGHHLLKVADGGEALWSLVEEFGIVNFLGLERVDLMTVLDFGLDLAEICPVLTFIPKADCASRIPRFDIWTIESSASKIEATRAEPTSR